MLILDPTVAVTRALQQESCYLILFVFCSEDQQLKEELPEEYYKLDPEHDDQVRNPDLISN